MCTEGCAAVAGSRHASVPSKNALDASSAVMGASRYNGQYPASHNCARNWGQDFIVNPIQSAVTMETSVRGYLKLG